MVNDPDMTDPARPTENGDVHVKEPPKVADPQKVTPVEAFCADVRRNIGILEKAVQGKELRLLARVLRSTGNLRKRVTPPLASRLVSCYVPASYAPRAKLLAALAAVPPAPSAMDVVDDDDDGDDDDDNNGGNGGGADADGGANDDAAATDGDVAARKANASTRSNYAQLGVPAPSATPEVAAYLHLVGVLVLLDAKRLQDAVQVGAKLVESLGALNRRTMDEINARSYFYYARAVELSGSVAGIRAMLLSAYRTATLRHDAASQAVLLNLLLRNYIAYNLYDQADKLLSRAKFPETRSNNQLARYLYYTGRVKAMQLDYSDALWNLQQALRKAPQSSALGFRTSVQKFMIIVQLLTGEVPSRDTFRQPQMQRALRPYLSITQAVRAGDLQKFKHVLEASAEELESDQTMSLIIRLRHSVIKTGLRMLSSSYSRISLAEICTRLSLDSPENAEGVVAKAIHDGVIDAVIDHRGGFVRSNETIDVYSTTEPTDAYHSRIEFCLNVYKEAVRAMRFPEKRDDEETPEQRRERLKEQEELAKTLAEEDDEDYEP